MKSVLAMAKDRQFLIGAATGSIGYAVFKIVASAWAMP